MTDTVVRFASVRKSFERGAIKRLAVDDLSFEVSRGECVCILGRSGAGKSTTINMLLGLIKPDAGEVTVLGEKPYSSFNSLRGKVACIFQNDRLLPWRTAIDNVRFPLEIIGLKESELELSASGWLDRVGLAGTDMLYPHELSGGMRQRVSIARALISNPELILADEAFSSLDPVTSASLRDDFRQLAKENGKTIIHITHSMDEALALADTIVVLGRPGKVLATFSIDRSVDAVQSDLDEIRGSIVKWIEETAEPATNRIVAHEKV